MTVTNSTLESSLFSGNGVTTAFATGFQFQDEADIQVVLKASDGTETVQTLTTHYTVTGANNPSGGTVTMVTPPASGEKLRIVRNLAYTQETDYTEGTAFPAETHEAALDRLTQQVQQLAQEVKRSPKLPITSANYPSEFPDGGSTKAGHLIRWNTTNGGALESVSATDAALGVTTTAFSRTLLDDASASEARTTLGVVIGTDVQAQSARLSDVANIAATDGTLIVGDGTNFVGESGATARTSLGLGTGDTPQFTGIELGNASDTTITRPSAGNIAVEGNVVYRAGGTDVPLADGGTGASLTAPAGDRIMFYDQSAGTTDWLTVGTNLSITGTTLNATGGGGGGLANVVEDTTPQLGGDLDVNGHSIVSASNGNITITPNGTGDLVLDGLKWPQADGTANYVLKTNGAGQLSWVAQSGGTSATQSDQETATSTTAFVSPGRQQYHPSASKAWLKAGVSGNNLASYNISSLTDTGTGVLTVTYTTAMSSADYVIVCGNISPSGGAGTMFVTSQSTTGCVLRHENSANGSAVDPTNWFMATFGDQ